MKKIILFVAFLTIISCNKQIEKPEKFLDEDQMTNLLYDMTLLSSSRSLAYEDSIIKNLTPKVVLNKYGLDSLSFVELNDYYIQQPELYAKMFDTITKRFQKLTEKTELLPNEARDSIDDNIILHLKKNKAKNLIK